MKNRLAFASMALIVLTLSGCGANMSNSANPGADVMNATRQGVKNTMNVVTGKGTHAAHQTSKDMRSSTVIANGLVRDGYAKHAFAFVVGDNAYVAIEQRSAGKTTLGLQDKNKISASVKRLDKHIKTVYVSANPDAYARFQSFTRDMSAGRPVSAVWDNFRTTITRVFPTAH